MSYADSFAPEAVYELKVDTNADAVADIAYRFTFSSKEDDVQKATVRRISGEQAKGKGDDGDLLFQDVSVSFGEEAIINTMSDPAGDEYCFFAGIRSDPFFFDLDGMKNNMQFTGADTFLDKNVFSIVLEIPNTALGNNPKVGIWYRVLIPKDKNPFFVKCGNPDCQNSHGPYRYAYWKQDKLKKRYVGKNLKDFMIRKIAKQIKLRPSKYI
jgi:Domain of unknown function (DUF4331)